MNKDKTKSSIKEIALPILLMKVILIGSIAGYLVLSSAFDKYDEKHIAKEVKQLEDIQNSNEYIIEIDIKDDVMSPKACIIKKNTYDAYAACTLNDFTYKDEDGKLIQTSVDKIKSIKLIK